MYNSPLNGANKRNDNSKSSRERVISKHSGQMPLSSQLARASKQAAGAAHANHGRNVGQIVPALQLGGAVKEGAVGNNLARGGRKDANQDESVCLPNSSNNAVSNNQQNIMRTEGELIDNNDGAGNSIVSRITRSLGSLKTLSGAGELYEGEAQRNFNLFSHHALLKEGKPLDLSYTALREGILELYLSVKIRSDDEIDNYNEDLFREEKLQMKKMDGFSLIDQIKTSIEMLMNMKVEEQDEIENPDLFDGSLDALRRSINRHEQSASGRQFFKQKGSTLEIEEKMIEIRVGPVKPGE